MDFSFNEKITLITATRGYLDKMQANLALCKHGSTQWDYFISQIREASDLLEKLLRM